ncbi:hypothetical protein CI15_14870 [Paraburkholderia monticola]|uniref:MFS transporter n=1 Tax=Paraburkholderia monticola TaxID=1399968 RepID=A0A149PQZ5_9BURK|nr:DUF2946 domain-containing protein [Paraburkholderia monticola]KXU87432.1 hypothetical protein CI15_14870 [Paraburkholderia monticola]
MFNRWHRKIGSWLGLLAILMTTLAPSISQTLAAHRHADAMMGEHCEMASMGDMASMPGMPMQDMQVQDDGPDPTQAAADAPAPSDAAANPAGNAAEKHAQMSGDACGYCSLLAHLPVMPSVGMLFVAAVRARQHVAATRFDSVRRVEPLTFAQPRAPPFAS